MQARAQRLFRARVEQRRKWFGEVRLDVVPRGRYLILVQECCTVVSNIVRHFISPEYSEAASMRLDPCEEVQSSGCWLFAVQTRSPVIGFDLRIGPRRPASNLKLCCTIMYVEVQMWRQISHRLADYPGRLKVARTLVELGLSVKEGKVFCGDVEQ